MEKRQYQRVETDLGCIFYVESEEHQSDYNGQIKDISENGVAIKISNEKDIENLNKIEPGTVIKFQTFDNYSLFGIERREVVSASAIVVRKVVRDEMLLFGLWIQHPDRRFEKYIEDKKVCEFVNNGCNIV